MVTPEEARKQIEQRRLELAKAQERLRVQAQQFKPPTAQELRQRGLESLRQRKLSAQARKQIAQVQIGISSAQQQFESQVKQITPEIARVEQAIAQQQERVVQARLLEDAKSIFSSRGASPSFFRFPRAIREQAIREVGGERAVSRSSVQLAELKSLGLDPVISSTGQIVGFEDLVSRQSVSLESLPLHIQVTRPELEKPLIDLNIVKKGKLTPSFVEAIELSSELEKKLTIVKSASKQTNTKKVINFFKGILLQPATLTAPSFQAGLKVTDEGLSFGITPPTSVEIRQIKQFLRTQNKEKLKGFLSRKFGEDADKIFIVNEVIDDLITLIPETRIGVAGTIGLGAGFIKLGAVAPRVAGIVEVGFTAWNIADATNPEETRSRRLIAGAFAGLGIASLAVRAKGFLDRRSPNFIPIDETGINFVPANTVPLTTNEIKNLQGLAKTTIHVTNNPFFKFDKNGQLLIKAFPSEAGGTRRNLKLFNFYKSLSKNNPNAYLGYVGIVSDKLDDTTSGVKITLRRPKINAFIFPDEKITPTPEWVIKRGFAFTRDWQNRQSGKTFVPVENLFGLSIEGQVISPAFSGEVLKNGKWFVISGKELDTALKDGTIVRNLNKGSIIQKIKQTGFTYFKQVPESPKFIKKIALLDKLYQKLGTRFIRINLIEAKTLSVAEINSIDNAGDLIKLKNIARNRVKELDIKSYNSFASKFNLPISDLGASIVSSARILSALSGGVSPVRSTTISGLPSLASRVSGLTSTKDVSIVSKVVSPLISKAPISKVPSVPKISKVPSVVKPSRPFTSKKKKLGTSLVVPSIVSKPKAPISPVIPSKSKGEKPSRGLRFFTALSPLQIKSRLKKSLAPRRKVGWFPEAKAKITKEWVRLSPRPMTKLGALSRMAKVVDHSISASGRVRPSKRFKGKLLRGSNYWNFHKEKFREFKIRKGKRVSTPNRFIEKKGKPRIDTRGEKKDLSIAKFLAREKKAFGLLKSKSKPLIKLKKKKK